MKSSKAMLVIACTILVTMALGPSVGFSAGPCIPCEDLADMDFGPEVTILSAILVDVGLDSEHCRVEGTELPENNFIVKLPTV